MKCEMVKEYLPFYCYNDLDKIKMSQIKKHIKSCENCKREFNRLKKTLKLVEKEGKIRLNFIQKRILLNRIFKSVGLQKERIFLQRKRAFALGSSFAAAALLIFFLLLNTKTVNMNLNWQNDHFTYGVEEFNRQITEKEAIIPDKTLTYNFDERIEDIYEDMEELAVLLDYSL